MTAVTVAQNLVDHLISFFGVPATKLMDGGTLFKSALFNEITWFIDAGRHWNADYHPRIDDIFKRIHITLMMSLTSKPDPQNWAHYLLLVLLSIRTIIRGDLGFSSAKICLASHYDCPETRPQIKTTTYKPTSPMSQPSFDNKTRFIPLVLLFIGAMIKEDWGNLPVELTFDTTMRLREDFVCLNCNPAKMSRPNSRRSISE